MDLRESLRELESEWEGFFREVEGFFSPGMDKYNGYSSFVENFTTDMVEVPSIQEEVDFFGEEPGEELFPEKVEEENPHTTYHPRSGFFYPGVEVRRVPAHVLGYGVLGRCFPYSGIIEIRNDLYGDEFTEVLTHELTHLNNPHLGELDVRIATRMKLPFTPRWH